MRACSRRLAVLWLFLWLANAVQLGLAAQVPAWVKAILDPGINRAVSLTWEDEDGVLYWNVNRNCSESDEHGKAATAIRVTQPRLVDHRRELNESCTYRVEACDFDGCSPQSQAVSAVMGAVPSAPPVVAAWPSQNDIISVRYLPPANAGGGTARVLVTNYRVELSLDAAFSSIAHTTESHDGGIFLQHIRAMKGRRYWVRVTAANAEGWGDPGVFSSGSVRCLSTPGPPSDVGEVLTEGHLALRIEWRPPLDTGAWDTTEPVLEYLVQVGEAGTGFSSLTAARRVQGNQTSLVLNRLPRTRLTVRIAAANVVGLGTFFTLGAPASPSPAGAGGVHISTSQVGGPGKSGAVGYGVAVMALPGPPLPLYAGPCGPLALCLVFEPPRDTGWPANSGPSDPLSGGPVGWSVGGGGPLRFRVDVSISADFTSGVLSVDGEGIIGEEATARDAAFAHDDGSRPYFDVYSPRYVRWRITGLAKGVYYHFRVSAYNGIGWGRPGVLGHPAETSAEFGSTAGGRAGADRKYLTEEDADAPLDGAARWEYYLASAVLPCSGSFSSPTAVFPPSISSPLQRGCGSIHPGSRGLQEFHDSLRVSPSRISSARSERGVGCGAISVMP